MSTNTNDPENDLPNLFNKVVTFLEPSLLGFIIYMIIILAPVVTGLILSRMSGSTSLNASDFQGTFLYSVLRDINSILNAKQVNSLLDYAFWAIIATIIYTIAHALVGGADELSRDLRIRKYVWPKGSDRNRPLEMYAVQFVFRIVIGIAILIYMFKLLPALDRYFNLSYLHAEKLGNVGSLLTNMLIELLLLHIGVLLLRLFRMRNRVVDF
ncbi:MAG TPA: hypothetical protein VIH90_06370 [Candidatus Saccharimonadales bacterium]